MKYSLNNKKEIKKIIDEKSVSIKNYKKKYNSWELLDSFIALKTLDKSFFIYNMIGVPMGIRSFFDEALWRNEKKQIKLIYKDKTYCADFELDNFDNPRSRIIWKNDFKDLIIEVLPKYYDLFNSNQDTSNLSLPKIKFKKESDNNYLIDFVIPDMIISDLESEEFEDNIIIKDTNEGEKEIYYYGKKYEQSFVNRREVIEYNGTICKICKFDFEKVYGKRGRNYIEIHHIKPLSSLNDKVYIDPRYDFIPVCANCHRIIHREKDNILSQDEVKDLIELNKR